MACVGFSILIILLSFIISLKIMTKIDSALKPDKLIKQYMDNINKCKYEEMYALLCEDSQINVTRDDFIARNKNIYEGIEAKNLIINITGIEELDNKQAIVTYDTSMETLAGKVEFSNRAYFLKKEDKEYHLLWSPKIIFPALDDHDTVRVRTLKAERGSILDRNGEILAGKGTASSIGLVPGKMGENRALDIVSISELLDIPVENINKWLNASYVKEDTFVPIKTISKNQDELEEALLQIPGIKITDINMRVYPFGEKTSHLIGYIQGISAEELEALKEQNYNANSEIGKCGLEKIYEQCLRGIDGYEIVIIDNKGNEKITIAKKNERDGESIQLTIDMRLQNILYEQFCEDKSCSVAMNPKTGEVLALVSTPTFNSNDFVLGMSQSKWQELNEDENKPLFNRFKAALCPGSCFKPIIGAIGVNTGRIDPTENYECSGLGWQKDTSWGSYKITTLKDYKDQANLQNALIYSDNIYFAKAALNIGDNLLAEQLTQLGFGETIPFEYGMNSSSYSNTETFETDIQLADSGYGQGEILINPLHMTAIYSSFVNDGNMIKPYLIYQSNPSPEYWKKQVFDKETARILRDDLIQVIERGTGMDAKIDGLMLAGKTGTAELKQTKDDREGTELGWFSAFTVDENLENPLIITTMVEDVKNRGGSNYVIKKVKLVFESRNKANK